MPPKYESDRTEDPEVLGPREELPPEEIALREEVAPREDAGAAPSWGVPALARGGLGELEGTSRCIATGSAPLAALMKTGARAERHDRRPARRQSRFRSRSPAFHDA